MTTLTNRPDWSGFFMQKIGLYDLFISNKFAFTMAYNKKNYHKRARFIIQVYKDHKFEDVPDTKIVTRIFPKFGIDLSYRQWMNIKGMKIPKE